jgi:hypothetical protein
MPREPVMKPVFSTLIAAALGFGALSAPPEVRVPEIAVEEFERLREAMKPQRGESSWREIAWLTSVKEGWERAAAEGKPIIIFTAADGSPLART